MALQAPEADRVWPPMDQAGIRPGSRIQAALNQCTANFVFTGGDEVYLGLAAHCLTRAGRSGASCTTEAHGPGTPVLLPAGTRAGEIVYSSWHTMNENGEDPDGPACRFNDFALARIHPDDHAQVHPAVLGFGGPTSLADSTLTQPGDVVAMFQNSQSRFGALPLQRARAVVASEDDRLPWEGGEWLIHLVSATPGIPGDSGAPVLTSDGAALGVLRTLEPLPPGSNGVVSLDRALAYMHQHTTLRVALAAWPDFQLLPESP